MRETEQNQARELAKQLRKTDRCERRQETSLLELEAQSHPPHPAREGKPGGRTELPDAGRGVRAPEARREALQSSPRKRATPGAARGWGLAPGFCSSSPILAPASLQAQSLGGATTEGSPSPRSSWELLARD